MKQNVIITIDEKFTRYIPDLTEFLESIKVYPNLLESCECEGFSYHSINRTPLPVVVDGITFIKKDIVRRDEISLPAVVNESLNSKEVSKLLEISVQEAVDRIKSNRWGREMSRRVRRGE